MKVWKVTVNQIGWSNPKTYYASSRELAEKIGDLHPASDPVEYAGNFAERNAEQMQIFDSIESFKNWYRGW